MKTLEAYQIILNNYKRTSQTKLNRLNRKRGGIREQIRNNRKSNTRGDSYVTDCRRFSSELSFPSLSYGLTTFGFTDRNLNNNQRKWLSGLYKELIRD